jgi:hypothetical protein
MPSHSQGGVGEKAVPRKRRRAGHLNADGSALAADMPVSCDTFLHPREVNLKNYVFRTGLNWRFDWGKAPVAVMAKY